MRCEIIETASRLDVAVRHSAAGVVDRCYVFGVDGLVCEPYFLDC